MAWLDRGERETRHVRGDPHANAWRALAILAVVAWLGSLALLAAIADFLPPAAVPRLVLQSLVIIAWTWLILLPRICVSKDIWPVPALGLLVAAEVTSAAWLFDLPLEPALPLALGSVVLLLAGAGLVSLLARRWPADSVVFWLLLAVSTLATSPVWAAPLLENHTWPQTLLDSVVAINPITYLALLADWDWLRQDWLYRHSPLGSLRYGYPSINGLTSTYLGTGLAAWLTSRWQPLAFPSRLFSTPGGIL